jgi:hypothetical protein
MNKTLALLLLVLATPAFAQEPTEEQKINALKHAYELSSGATDVRPVKTERIIPVAAPEEKNAIDKTADDEARRLAVHRALYAVRQMIVDKKEQDVCERHGMHKVLLNGGKSWHCKK